MSRLATIRRFLWVVPVVLGVIFIAAGAYMVAEGNSAKDEVRAQLVDEKITTSEDASIPNVPVNSAATAKAQADVIKTHTLERTEGLTYAQLDREDPLRDTYLTSVTLRSALMQAYMGFKIADLVMGVGALVIALGAANLFLMAPVLFWTRQPESTVAHRGAGTFAPAPAPAGGAR